MANNEYTITVDLRNKTAKVVGVIAFREEDIQTTVINLDGANPANLTLAIIRKDTLQTIIAAMSALGANAVGSLNLNTTPLEATFRKASDQGTKRFSLTVWDNIDKRLLVNYPIDIMNNPYDVNANPPSPIPVDEYMRFSIYDPAGFREQLAPLAKLNIDSIADLSSIDGTLVPTVNVRGYYTANDGGGGIFNYDSSQSAVNNGGTIINGWVRQYYGVAHSKWFGAKHDGSTDDTIALQAWVDTTGDLFLDSGTAMSDLISLSGHTHIKGSGKIKLNSGQNSSLLYDSGTKEDIVIEDIFLDGNGANNGASADTTAVIYIGNGTTDCVFYNVTVENAAQNGLQLAGANINVKIMDCYIRGSIGRRGIDIARAANGTRIIVQGCILGNNAYGDITATSAIIDCVIDGNVCYGVTVPGGGDSITGYNASSGNNIISNNILRDSPNHGIHVAGSNIIIEGNTINSPQEAGIYLTDTEYSVVSNNTIKGVSATQSIMLVSNCDNIQVSGNNISNHTGGGAGVAIVSGGEGFVITDNIITAPRGIDFASAITTDSIVANNIINAVGDYGIEFNDVQHADNLIRDNIITGVTADIYEGSICGNRYFKNDCETISILSTSLSVFEDCLRSVASLSQQNKTTTGSGITLTTNHGAMILTPGSATTYNSFSPVWNGRRLSLFLNSANATVVHGSGVNTKTGANVSGPNVKMDLISFNGTTWNEL